jgi:hypothetical protein
MYRYILLVVFVLAFTGAHAQMVDTTMQRSKKDKSYLKRDSATSKPFVPKIPREKIYHPDSTHSPRKAVIRSLMFPGLGQIYNGNGLWYRLPALYGGMAALIYNLYSNGKDYGIFLQESIWREHGRVGPEPLPVYGGSVITNLSDQTIYDYKDNLRRNRDLSIFGLFGVYGIAAIDAYVDAKFIHSYTMDSNLSFKVSPTLSPMLGSGGAYASNFNTTFMPTLKITLFLR